MQAEWQGINQEQAGSRLLVTFFLEAEKNEEESMKEGRPIYVEKEWIKIQVPGDKDNNVCREVRYGDKERFPQEYAAFKNKAEQPVHGTLLEKIPFLSKAQVLEFNGIGVRTAEQFRDLSDSFGQKVMGFNTIKRQITAFLDAASGSAATQKMAQELEKRDEELALLKQIVDEQSKKIEEISRRK